MMHVSLQAVLGVLHAANTDASTVPSKHTVLMIDGMTDKLVVVPMVPCQQPGWLPWPVTTAPLQC